MKNSISTKKPNRVKAIVRHFKNSPPQGYGYISSSIMRPLEKRIDDYWIREIELHNREYEI